MLIDRREDRFEQRNRAADPAVAEVAQRLRLRMLERLMQSQVYGRRDGKFTGIQSGSRERIPVGEEQRRFFKFMRNAVGKAPPRPRL